jgi:hypothetical protein
MCCYENKIKMRVLHRTHICVEGNHSRSRSFFSLGVVEFISSETVVDAIETSFYCDRIRGYFLLPRHDDRNSNFAFAILSRQEKNVFFFFLKIRKLVYDINSECQFFFLSKDFICFFLLSGGL